MTTPEEIHEGLILTGPSALVRRMDQRLELVSQLMEEIAAKEASRTRAEMAEFTAVRAISLHGMVQVAAGRLPVSSELGPQSVDTFFIGKTAVTWSEWQTVRTWAAANGYDLGSVGYGNGPNHPVTDVDWYQALKWCNARSEKEGLRPVYKIGAANYRTGDSVPTIDTSANGYRLPTEKEWEFAARGGVKTNGYEYSGSNDIDAVAWSSSNSSGGTQDAATKQANELGLYDMSGNVWERCFDIYSGTFRVIRGGGWDFTAYGCRVADRISSYPSGAGNYIGFRVVRSSVP
jgi:formylglycine-generating enzyme required for sulfatase activity